MAASVPRSDSRESPPLVLVTGASGFVGSHCVRVLLACGFQVRGTVRDPYDDAKVAPIKALEGAKERLRLVAANLLRDEGWEEAMKECTYVLHVASPFPLVSPKDKEELIRPAVDGTMRVLRAAAAEPGVRRVVLTSSVAAVSAGYPVSVLESKTFSEEDWSDLESGTIEPYPESKTLAERAAWEYIREGQPEGRGLQLATINPSLVIGPMIRQSPCSSAEVVANLMERRFSVVPDLNLWVVDVRDVAEAHVKAMLKPEADGKRFLLSSREYGMREMSRTLAGEFNDKGFNVPTGHAPNWMIRFAGCFGGTASMIAPRLGLHERHDHSRAEEVLGIRWRDAEAAAIQLAGSGAAFGLIKAPEGFAFETDLGEVRTEGITVEEAD